MNVPENLKYTKSHEWALIEGNNVKVGITDYAQSELTDIVFVELPEVGNNVEQGKEAVVIESVKTAVDVYAPVSGKVVEVNSALEDAPEIINSDPYNEGWIFTIEMSDASQADGLLAADAYKTELPA